MTTFDEISGDLERQAIAREMHDVLAHRISLVSVHAGALAYRARQAGAGTGPVLEGGEIADSARVIVDNAHLALEELQMTIQGKIYNDLVGADVEVLVEGRSARSAADVKGHTSCNKVINFRGSHGLAGKIVTVRVTGAKSHSLYGEASNVL